MIARSISLLVIFSVACCYGKIQTLQDIDSSAEEYNRYQEASKDFAQLVRNAGPGFRVKVISNDRPPDPKGAESTPVKGARSDIAIKTVEKEEPRVQSSNVHSSSDLQRFVSVMHSIVFTWSPWSEWTACSRTCGGGVSSRKRTCRREYARVTPGSGIRTSHQKCIGDSTEFRSCAPQPCAVLVDTSKTNQCSVYNGRTIGGITVTKWIPYAGGTNPCELACLADGKNFYYTFGKVTDGTPCGQEGISGKLTGKEVCVNGRCLPVGCDGKVNSLTSPDMCGVCGGSNSTCMKVAAVVFTDVPASDSPMGGTQESVQAPSQYGYNLVVRVPRHATHVKVVDNSTNYLAVLDGKTKKYIFNGDWVIDWPGNYEAGGTRFEYNRQKDHSETLSADGPVEHDVTIMLLQRAKNPGIYYEYWIPKENSRGTELRRHRPQPIFSSERQVTKKPDNKTKLKVIKTTSPSTTAKTTPTPPPTTTIQTKAPPTTPAPSLPTAASLVRNSGAQKMYYTYGNSTYQKFPIVKNKLLLPKTSKKRYDVRTNEISPDAWSATWVLEDKEWERKQVKENLEKEKAKKRKVKRKKKKEEQYCSFSCRRKQNARKHFCLSEFAIKAKILHYDVIKEEIRYEVQILQSYKNTLPMLSREYIWAAGAKCFCPRLKVGQEYIMLGASDKAFRKNEARFYLSSDSYVRPHNRANLERILRLRRDEVRYCTKYKHLM